MALPFPVVLKPRLYFSPSYSPVSSSVQSLPPHNIVFFCGQSILRQSVVTWGQDGSWLEAHIRN